MMKATPVFRIMVIFCCTLGYALISGVNQIKATEDLYQQGLNHWNEKKYRDAVRYFRQVSPDSVMYEKSLNGVQWSLYQQGKDAFEQKRYQTSIYFLNKIDSSNPSYPKAQQLKALAEYYLLFKEYPSTQGLEKRKLFAQLVQLATLSQDPETLEKMTGMILEEIARSNSTNELFSLLKLFQSLLAQSQDTKLLQAGLTHLYGLLRN